MAGDAVNFEKKSTLKWSLGAGDYLLWIRWTNLFSSSRDLKMLDIWEMRDEDTVTMTNRISDLPVWFELHPTEVSGLAACLEMQQRVKSGYRPGEPMTGRNLWRIPAGDRLVRVRSENLHTGEQPLTVIEFNSDALVIGERGVHPYDIAWFLSFGAPLEWPPKAELACLLHAGIEAVRGLGIPQVVADIGEWSLGS
jgi:hypothetical protein